jgi:hypothetical protein
MSPPRVVLVLTGVAVFGALAIAIAVAIASDETAVLPASLASTTTELSTTSAAARQSALVHYYGENRAFPADANQRGVVVANPWYRDQASRINAEHPAALVLAYKNVWAVTTSGARDRSLPAGLAYETVAARSSWQLHDGSGAWLRFSDYPNLWQANAGDADYQRAWVASVLTDLAQGPFDGVFLDDLLTSADAHHPGATSPAYPTDADMLAATRSFLTAVTPPLRAAGLVVVGNIPAAYRHAGLWGDWLGLIDGAMEENFVHYSTGQFVDDRGGEWSAHVAELETATAQNKPLVVHTERGRGDDSAVRSYAYGSYLLASGPTTFFSYGDTFTIIPEAGVGLGPPTSPRYEIAPGVWARQFANGIVVVNPSAKKVAVDLPEALRMAHSDGSVSAGRVASITIDATRAAILLR